MPTMTMSDGTSRASSRARASTAAYSTAWNKPPARRATASAKAATAVIHQPWRPSGRMDQLGPRAAQQAAHEAAGLLCFGRARRGRRSGYVAAAKPEVDVGPENVDGDPDACVVARKVDADVDARIYARDAGIDACIDGARAEIHACVDARVDARDSGVD